MELARGQLSTLAAGAGLRLSFSAERSVADELARESYADVSTVSACACVSVLGNSSTAGERATLPSPHAIVCHIE